MNGITPWASAASLAFVSNTLPDLFNEQLKDFTFIGRIVDDSLWIEVNWANGGLLGFRAAYAPGGNLEAASTKKNKDGFTLKLDAVAGKYEVVIKLIEGIIPILRYTTTFTPVTDTLIPFWPRDIIVPGKDGKPENTAGKVLVSQVGTRSGQLYFHLTRPKAGAILYLQNLTALADYCEQTESSAGDVVGGEWPELGFALPPTLKGKPLEGGKAVIISDAFVAFDNNVPVDEPAMVRQYLHMLSELYLQLPKPDTTYKEWPDILDKGLKDLIDSPGCWSQVQGDHYFNAYVSDYDTPPEVMVQAAVLLPLVDYTEWRGIKLEIIDKIIEGLPAFYDEKFKTIMRWHPAMVEEMEAKEEQMKPLNMDSWYLHHPLLNLSRMALKGDKTCKKLFLDSLEYCMKVAHHFDYEWPVFYKMDTLEVTKAETQPGKGGEKDVPGSYAHVMLQAWDLTGDKRYLAEAEKSAQKLAGLGFELFYQANNTAFSAGALLRLYKITKKEIYKDLSYLCLANVFKNVRLWDCKYGYGKNFPSFFTLFPLSDAPYAAVYEEQEAFCAFHDYLRQADGEDIFPPVRLLLAEYIRYLVDRAVYYYPPMLPKEMLQEKPKTGEVDHNLWIALEDLHDGWEKSGQVGQEVYGAGNSFGILPRHYLRLKGEDFMVYTDYPTHNFIRQKNSPVSFKLLGDGRLTCRMLIVKTSKKKLPEFEVKINNSKVIPGKAAKGGNLEFEMPGNAAIKIKW